MEINSKIEKAKKGDQIAFTFLLDYFWNEVYGFMLKRTENETIAEDITIETFSKAFDKIATYNSEFQFNTWLIAIAKNVYIDLLRKKKTNLFIEITDAEDQQAYNIADPTPSAEDALIKEQNLSRLLLCITIIFLFISYLVISVPISVDCCFGYFSDSLHCGLDRNWIFGW